MRSIQIIVISATLWLCIPATVEAQNWRQVYRDANVTVSLDTSRISRADNSYTVLLRWQYASPRYTENRAPYVRMIQQTQVRCTPTPIRVKRFAAAVYSETGVLVEEARPLTPAQLRFMDWERPPANSDGARVYPALCRTLAAGTGGRRA